MKICMAGACGRMGRRILEMAAAAEDIEIGGAFDIPANAGVEITAGLECGRPVTVTVSGNAAAGLANADVLIDFTMPEACLANARTAAGMGVPVVIGTTGLSPAQIADLRVLAEKIPVVHAPNMSVGVNLLFKLTRQVVEAGPHVRVRAEDRRDLLREVLVELLDLFLRARLPREGLDLLLDVPDVAVEPLDVGAAHAPREGGGREEERPREGGAPAEIPGGEAGHFAVTTKWARRFWDHALSLWPSTKGRSSP